MAASPPKHDIHKYRDIRPKLSRDNWVSCKRELLATVRDKGLYNMIRGTDIHPNYITQGKTTISGVEHIGATPVTQLIEEWSERNNAAYNQILLNLAPDQQTAIDETDSASEAWSILTGKHESHDPSKVSIIRTRYENHHMLEGQPVNSYLTTMKEYRSQLGRMGEIISDSTHAATILYNQSRSAPSRRQFG